ncbi:TIGR00730 family Rossman fold protein [Aidingimonas halophila]|uniref:Cytokinin riboside 5'-monophosphate phosphoribohydrolase n=1 Tax=Aidingimonas halophila TaxID=574349 RepID=A0A1H2VX94_9GAMM|nr:TIGR00730 family Rossman fold protein [Aidingimonas halophila]GHC24921.1 putative cytokinin riboside 5'-monophosphate phosphoribohydrolase [Aidingimonas halophila]SDW72965.1 hypothetical protein SAMN05443545_102515 [Aidingimonas halophila]
MASICVYLGSREGREPHFREAAAALGHEIAQRGHRLVYGGGRIGLMGAIADATLAAGGNALGVMPTHLIEREQAHYGLTKLIHVDDMHQRKATMALHADAFIALPGGIGTLEELFESWTWQYLGLHDKPIGVLDVEGFYTPLLQFLDTTVESGFLAPQTRATLCSGATPKALLTELESRL